MAGSSEEPFDGSPEEDHVALDEQEHNPEENSPGNKIPNDQTGDSYIPRPKRVACILCRKRKLRCDGNKPSCGTCSRLGHNCAYDEVRKKSGPKRGYVKLLEARLKEVENRLQHSEPTSEATNQQNPTQAVAGLPAFQDASNLDFSFPAGEAIPGVVPDPSFTDPSANSIMPDFGLGASDDFCWEMIGLGLEEPLPTQDIIDELNEIYFRKIHPSLPMLHRPRYFAAMNLAPQSRPPIGLRYAMWTLASSVTDQYNGLTEHFYARARKYLQQDELRGHGESMVTLAHAQAWTLVACYEFKIMYFPRAWMSCGRANRLAQMMGLHRLDGVGLDVKQTLSPPRDWTEREERRRTFWMIFCQDRYASIGTGWPMTIDERDIMTNLPVSDEAFLRSKPAPTISLSEAMKGDGASTLSSFGAVILLACLFGRNLTHLHRPNSDDRDHDLHGDFWKRHRELDNILLQISLSLPSHLRLPAGLADPNIIFCNLNIHTSTICLHQAAIFKADKNEMSPQISAESKRRCIVAADQITNIMKIASHVDLSLLNPFISFCLYVSARVFVQYLKSKRLDLTVRSSLQFLLVAMAALKAKNPLTESFLIQLDVDLEASGLDIRVPPATMPLKFGDGLSRFQPEDDALKCSPIFEIRQSQAKQQNTESGYAQSGQLNVPLRGVNGLASVVDPASQPRRWHGLANDNGGWNPGQTGQQSWGEMDTSPDITGRSSSLSKPPSDHATPSSYSNKNSSHTSFSPQNIDSSYGTSSSGVSPNVGSSTYQGPSSTNQFQAQAAIPRNEGPFGMNTPFAMPASWDYSQDGPANTGTGQQQQNPNNLSYSGTETVEGSTGLTPMSIPEWQGPDMGENWMYGDWTGNTPQPL